MADNADHRTICAPRGPGASSNCQASRRAWISRRRAQFGMNFEVLVMHQFADLRRLLPSVSSTMDCIVLTMIAMKVEHGEGRDQDERNEKRPGQG